MIYQIYQRKKILLTHYKNIENIRNAKIDELRSLLKINENTAKLIKKIK